jgi:hypothetical protein
MGTTNNESRNVGPGPSQPVHMTNNNLPPTGGASGVQPVSESDGANAALGAKADAAAASDTATASQISLFKRLLQHLTSLLAKFGTGASSLPVQGTAPSGAAVTGNPVLHGGSTGTNVVSALVTAAGRAQVAGGPGMGDGATSSAAAFPNSSDSSVPLAVIPYGVNSVGTADRLRVNHEVTALSSAARTTNASSGDLTNYNHRGVVILIDVTLVPGAAPSLVFTIRGKSSLGSDYYTLLTSVAITATGQTRLIVHPDLTTAANTIAKDVLPRVWDIDVAAGNGNSATYSVSANLVP